jgi:hypothetical protein
MAINNHKSSVHDTNNTHLQRTRANSIMPIFRVWAVSSYGQRNSREFVDISYITS